MQSLVLTQIWIYPVKSLGGIMLQSAKVLPKGLEHDRRWMLVKEDGTAMTQREFPKMTLFRTSLQSDGISVTFNNESILIPFTTDSAAELTATVWEQEVRTLEVSTEISEWFSQRLDLPCKLVFFPEAWSRPVDNQYQINDEHVSLADAYPLLVIGQSSLDDLNHRLKQPVLMNRFRPNLVFEGGEPFNEDSWDRFNIGELSFASVKPCARCILITTNQETALRGAEPLKTLASYRSKNNKVYFGQNILVLNTGTIRVGNQIIVESIREKVLSRV